MSLLISYNGISQPPAAWGVIVSKLTLVSQDKDVLELETKESVNNAPQFAINGTVDLILSGTRIFSGRVAQVQALGKAAGESNRYVIYGPWWYFEQIIYQQIRASLVTAGPPAGYTNVYTSRVVNFQTEGAQIGTFIGGAITQHITNGTQISNCVNYAISKYGVPIKLGAIAPAVIPPFEETRDITLADSIKRSLGWSPDCVAWWDYTQYPPALNVQPRATLESLTLDLNAATQVTDLQIMPRYDMQPSGVIFYFETAVTLSTGVVAVQIVTQTAGNPNGTLNAVINTFQLAGANSTTPETPPLGPAPNFTPLATLFWNAINTLHYEGRVEVTEQEVSYSLVQLGARLQLTNGRSEWATMNGLIQKVEMDFVSGKTAATFGPPTQLSVQDFLTLIQTSEQPGSSNLASTFPLGGGGSPLNSSYPSIPSTDVQVCSGGVTKTLHLFGQGN